jgi:hypothetical protein
MKRKQIDSSSIVSIGYDVFNRILEVEFTSHIVFQYSDVPLDVYEGLLSSPSRGAFFNKMIREKYSTRRVDAGL